MKKIIQDHNKRVKSRIKKEKQEYYSSNQFKADRDDVLDSFNCLSIKDKTILIVVGIFIGLFISAILLDPNHLIS